MKTNTKTLKSRENRLMFGMLAPSVLFVFLLSIVPLVYTFVLSFQDYNLLKGTSSYVGVENYRAILETPAMRESIWITIKYTVLSVGASTLVGIGLAIVVNQLTCGKGFFRIVFMVPMMLSGVVVGVLWRFLFSTDMGVINYLLEVCGFQRVNWIGSTSAAMTSIIIADVWQWSSFAFVNVLAALDALNPEPLEAARVDGASAIQTFFYIKLPTIMPVISVAVIFRVVWAFRNFDLIYSLTSGGPGTSTTTMAIEIFKVAFNQYKIGAACALSVLMFILLMALSVVILKDTMKEGKR